jgi:hypothetical protein
LDSRSRLKVNRDKFPSGEATNFQMNHKVGAGSPDSPKILQNIYHYRGMMGVKRRFGEHAPALLAI